MPAYDYRCRQCRRKVTFYYKSYAEYDTAVPICPHCQSRDLKRLIGRVALLQGEEARLDSLADDSLLSGLDEEDPRALGHFMRKMGREMGEDLGDDFDEVVGRLEKGESPEEIEKAMPELGAGSDAGGLDLE